MVEPSEPGRFVSRDIARGEAVEHELDAFVSKRHDQRVASEGERAVEEVWVDAERRQAAHRREENQHHWYEWHRYRADLYKGLSEEHARLAQGLGGAA